MILDYSTDGAARRAGAQLLLPGHAHHRQLQEADRSRHAKHLRERKINGKWNTSSVTASPCHLLLKEKALASP